MGIYILKCICIHTQICIAIYVTYKMFVCICTFTYIFSERHILGHLDDDFTTSH